MKHKTIKLLAIASAALLPQFLYADTGKINQLIKPTAGEILSNIPLAPDHHPDSRKVDDLLNDLSKKLTIPGEDEMFDSTVSRGINTNKNANTLFKPVGYLEISSKNSPTKRTIFALDDNQRLQRFSENSRNGSIKITRVSESGLEYKLANKNFFAPLSITTSEAPRANVIQNNQPQVGGSFGGQTQSVQGLPGQQQQQQLLQ